jgi:pyrroloquinoline quinone biosynthesis protein B
MKVIVLGSAQDAGVPQIGCSCETCQKARKYPHYQRYSSSLALYDREADFCYLFDASPDLKHQLAMLKTAFPALRTKGSFPITGIFLTHAHFGHCAGLWSLGKECLDAKKVPVYCSEKMAQFMKKNHPFDLLLERKNIQVTGLSNKEYHQFHNLMVYPFSVPHRNERADTVGYLINIENRLFLYLPDVDHWTEELVKLIERVELGFIDGTFYSKDEIPQFAEVPHPPIKETMKTIQKTPGTIYFTHFNHTNPVLLEGPEQKEVLEKGFKLAYEGLVALFNEE